MDRIEVSNLSRQFLFRQTDDSHPKSVRGEALEAKVGAASEDRFDDWFWESLLLC